MKTWNHKAIPCLAVRRRMLLEKRQIVIRRKFSVTRPILVADPNDGLQLDNNNDIINQYGSDRDQFDRYFQDKENAIKEQHRTDSNSAAADGVDADELNSWLQAKEELLKGLHDQKDDLLDLHDYLNSSESSEVSSHTGNEEESGNNEESPRVTNNSFPQDSSDITDDNTSSWEPFDE